MKKEEAYAQQCAQLRNALVNEIAALLEVNWPAIDRIRKKAGDEVAVSVQMKITGMSNLNGHVRLAYAEKYTDEGDVIVPDPSQPDLPGAQA